jgi:hypothetical protein
VPAPGLAESRAIVGNDEDSVAPCGRRDRGSKGGKVVCVAPDELHVGTVAAREAGQLVDVEPALAHLGEWYATIEQLFAEPSPRPLPQTPGIDTEGVEAHHQRPKPAERGI